MPIEIKMPQLGWTMESGSVAGWLVEEGDRFSGGQEILEVETDKATVLVGAQQAGTIECILVPGGQEVPIGTVLAIAVAPGEASSGDGSYLVEKLERLKRYGVVREVRGKGTLRGIELVKDATTMEPFPEGHKLGEALAKTALDNGIILRCRPDWFAVSPPLIAEESDIDEMCDLIEKSLRDALDMVATTQFDE